MIGGAGGALSKAGRMACAKATAGATTMTSPIAAMVAMICTQCSGDGQGHKGLYYQGSMPILGGYFQFCGGETSITGLKSILYSQISVISNLRLEPLTNHKPELHMKFQFYMEKKTENWIYVLPILHGS